MIGILRSEMAESASEAVRRVLASGWTGCGPQVATFEAALQSVVGCGPVVAVNSGSSALRLAYECVGLQNSDEVVTTPMTCLATNVPLLERGVRIRWSDVDGNGNIEPASVARLLTDRTRAIVVVHYAGVPADLGALSAIARRWNVPVIEDAAQALGSRFEGRSIGSHSDVVCFSFQSTKIVSCGDGGAVMVRAPGVGDRLRRLRWFGIDRLQRQEGDEAVREIGWKYEMNDVSAAIGIENLRQLESRLRWRAQIARVYAGGLEGVPGIEVPRVDEQKTPNWWVFPILAEDVAGLRRKLREKGVDSSPLHYRNDQMRLFRGVDRELVAAECPGLESWCKRGTCLPTGGWVRPEEAEVIVRTIATGW